MTARARNLILIALLGALVAGCAQPTAYQPADGIREGYAERRVAADRWRVSFAGNSLTPRTTVEDYLLHRAAEIARDEGAARFQVVTVETEPVTRFRGSSVFVGSDFSSGSAFHGSRSLGAAAIPADARPVTRYDAFMEVRLLPDATADGPDIYDATAILAAIGPRIRRPDAG
ncbi:CC0125/CC1285 family lipoprotein [Rubrimonas cliftonensis]|uniref:DUF4136 domain-containing protein n=1 Tax=Rubrimonas cliftonensis TaxID=89524 RepID=A0A1H4EZ78_9RHOB|nr:hypothetical protein [Rubrimonas cliftonensis]SEA90355.1 hypothetical protein SAMN05444370_11720 [Rubrimonas cliftonensis]